MPNRILREGILDSDRVNRLNAEQELFYRRLMSVVDDYGRFDARPTILRSKCYPLRVDDVTDADISGWLAALQAADLVVLYRVDGKPCLQLKDFRQRVRTPSRFPAPPTNDGQARANRQTDDGQMTVECQTDDGHLSDNCAQMTAPGGVGVGVGVGVEGGGMLSSLRSESSSGVPPDLPGQQPEDPPLESAKGPPEWSLALADRLREGQAARIASYRQPTPAALRRWAVEIERLSRIDGVAPKVIGEMVEWVLRDSFWANNIQSGQALREHWNQLVAKARVSDVGRQGGYPGVGPPGGAGGSPGLRQREVDAQAERRRARRPGGVPGAREGATGGDPG